MDKKRILLVDDDDDIRTVFHLGLEKHGFEVVAAPTVTEALRLIAVQKFDVLLSDLRMPDAGDGFTVVSAMRHIHPEAVTLVFSGYPALQEAMTAILVQADEIIAKPVALAQVVEIIQKNLAKPAIHSHITKECVAAILERDRDYTIRNWMIRVKSNPELSAIHLSEQDRTGHLPLLLDDLVRRLRRAPNSPVQPSIAARKHGILRRTQGYTIALVVEESRILQVCIFNTLQTNLASVDFSTVLLDVMSIADEVDSQLKAAVLGFMEPVAEDIALVTA
jgi:DNA-binding response OmpR family regulator